MQSQRSPSQELVKILNSILPKGFQLSISDKKTDVLLAGVKVELSYLHRKTLGYSHLLCNVLGLDSNVIDAKTNVVVISNEDVSKLVASLHAPDKVLEIKIKLFEMFSAHLQAKLLVSDAKQLEANLKAEVGGVTSELSHSLFESLLNKMDYCNLANDVQVKIIFNVLSIFPDHYLRAILNNKTFKILGKENSYKLRRYSYEASHSNPNNLKIGDWLREAKVSLHEQLISALNKLKPTELEFSPSLMIAKVHKANQKENEFDVEVCDLEANFYNKKDVARDILKAANFEKATTPYEALAVTMGADGRMPSRYVIAHEDVEPLLKSLSSRDEKSFAALREVHDRKLSALIDDRFKRDKNDLLKNLEQYKTYFTNIFKTASDSVNKYTTSSVSLSYDAFCIQVRAIDTVEKLKMYTDKLNRLSSLYKVEVERAMEAEKIMADLVASAPAVKLGLNA